MAGKIIPIQLMKGSKVIPITPDEYAREQQRVFTSNAATWILTATALFLFLSTFTVREPRIKSLCVFSSLAVAIASRLISGENVRADRIAKDHTDGSDSNRTGRILHQTNIEQVPVDSWYEAMEPEPEPDDYPHDLLCKPYDRDFAERLALSRNSKLFVGAPGAGKTVTGKAWIASLFRLFPESLLLINYRKVTSFCGLENISGCCAQSQQGSLSGLFEQMALIHAIHNERSNMEPKTRVKQFPAILYLVDYAATWNNIESVLKDRKHPLFKPALTFIERVGDIVTVGRENNVQIVFDTQSFNLTSLGNIDSNERGCLTTLGLGFESLDQWGQVSGNYEVLQLLIKNPFMIPNDNEREQIINWLPLMREYSQQNRQPLAFTTLGGSELFFLPDYRPFDDYILPPESIQRASMTIQRAREKHGNTLVIESETVDETVSAFSSVSARAETLKQPQDEEFQSFTEEAEVFTNKQLPPLEARNLIALLKGEGHSKVKIIEMLWDAKPGASKAYLKAKEEYEFLTQESE